MVYRISKIDSEGRKRYLSRAGHFALDVRFAWSFTAYGDVVRANNRFRETIETVSERRKAVRAGNAAIALLFGVSALSASVVYALHCASSFAQLFQF